MKFLVLGACGMTGHLVALYLQKEGHYVTGFARHEAPFLHNYIVGDAFNDYDLRCAIDSVRPDIIVNCIALLNAAADKQLRQAIYINSYLPHHLNELCESTAARIFHISSDGIFSGNRGPYRENSIPDDLTNYGRTKALGELNDAKNLTFRTSVIGPDINIEGIGLLNWFMKQSGLIKGYTGAIWTGLTSLELAKAIESCAREGSTGLVNMVPDASISKYELLRLFRKYIRCDSPEIVPDDSLKLDRTLIKTNANSCFRPVSYEQQIMDLGLWIRNNKELYPHYFSGLAL